MRRRDVPRGIEMCRDKSRCAEGVLWIYRDVTGRTLIVPAIGDVGRLFISFDSENRLCDDVI